MKTMRRFGLGLVLMALGCSGGSEDLGSDEGAVESMAVNCAPETAPRPVRSQRRCIGPAELANAPKAKFVIGPDQGGHYLGLDVSVNGTDVAYMYGTVYASASAAESAIGAWLRAALSSKRFSVERDGDDSYYVVLRAANGRQLGRTTYFDTQAEAERAATFTQRALLAADVGVVSENKRPARFVIDTQETQGGLGPSNAITFHLVAGNGKRLLSSVQTYRDADFEVVIDGVQRAGAADFESVQRTSAAEACRAFSEHGIPLRLGRFTELTTSGEADGVAVALYTGTEVAAASQPLSTCEQAVDTARTIVTALKMMPAGE